MLPKGTWQLRTFVTFAALCTAHGVARSQAIDDLPTPEPHVEEAPALTDAAPLAEPTPLEEAQPVDEVPPPEEAEALGAASSLDATTPTDATEPVVAPSAAIEVAPEVPGTVGNADIQEMVAAEFSDSTIIAVIDANVVEFDLSPRALVALKNAGVSEHVIEAMLAAATGERETQEPEPTVAQPAETQASIEYAKLTEMIEQLAAKQEASEKAHRAPEPPAARTDPTPRVWLVEDDERAPIAPTIAQVAFAGDGPRRGERMKNLQGLASQALAFASPAVSGIATTIGGLFRPGDERTAVWALAAPQSSRVLDVAPVFEIDYAHIPGVDPEKYQPAIVQLVPTDDNFRLVAAAETEGAGTRAVPSGPIIEETVATQNTRLDRGRYRVTPQGELAPGEYALVLRPIAEPARRRGRDNEASLGELLGGSTSQILYLTWEFSIEGEAVANAL
ncbi:MAG TPA: hypothetical protein VLI71_17210 [Gammaproteobacteria bacterium]|nr:hypothetical protein [Gammaproteobacteria bacterium]